MRPGWKRAFRIAAHAVAVAGLYLAVSGALFLGLQVDVFHGNVAVVVTLALVASYVWFGFVRKRQRPAPRPEARERRRWAGAWSRCLTPPNGRSHHGSTDGRSAPSGKRREEKER